MKALLDTNIIIHRESDRILNTDIGILFKWLDKSKYTKCIHPLSLKEIQKYQDKAVVETFKIKMESYDLLQTTIPLDKKVESVSKKFDTSENDKVDSCLLNDVYLERVDILITEDKKIHQKAFVLNISDKVFTINSFLEKVVSEHPELINYKVLSVKKEYFGNINLEDSFFDSLKEDYSGFSKWFRKKSDDVAYVSYNGEKLLSFLYLKFEDSTEHYLDIQPSFTPKRRLKIGTFKVLSNGVRLSERFLKIIFDNAILFNVNEIYVTIYNKRLDHQMLINVLEDWGFRHFGNKGEELVYVRDFSPFFNISDPKLSYPFISSNNQTFLVPIYPQYHTELLPDSVLTTESPSDFVESEPHRNAISKVYICRSINRDINKGDIMIFYRTAAQGKSGYYSSVISTIGIVEEKIDGIKSERDFLLKCRKRSIFSDEELIKYWAYKPMYRPFIIKFLYVYSFDLGKRINRQKLLSLGIITGQENELRGLRKITKEQFKTILKETNTNESLIVD